MHRLRVYPKRLFWRVYWAALAVSLILDGVWLYSHAVHYHFKFQYFPEFFALFGFIGCMLLILIAKGMGLFIVKEEDYYEKRSKQGNRVK
ncbi:MAG: hypothetical protein JRI76_04600 [Deltaproteobacteria bacterium]|nr:hypothetical protein [Deltaproteobacteria bacterium]MBW1954912.1 hypothetical protein [Deltaproteobacteria bacterium]MBW2041296.1 hypothetical protein [Deltaproteobacteria bacterium]MBW2131230.1 hypothetical protein [Deltaproteobacteria bacterium]